MNTGFELNGNGKKVMHDSDSVIIALYNNNYCSRLEYHLTNSHENLQFCDSIYLTSSCDKCFDVTLNSFIKSKSRKWRMESEFVYWSTNNKAKHIKFKPTREVFYRIKVLQIDKNSALKNPQLFYYTVWISKAEFKRIKKLAIT